MRKRTLPLLTLLLTLLPLALACSSDPSDATGDSDLSSSDSAVIDLASHAGKTLDVVVTDKTPSKVADAIVAAAGRGVAVRSVMVEGSHDPTWTLQQRLESSGVDIDVRKAAPAASLLGIADGTALLSAGSGVTRQTGADAVAKYVKAFDDVLAFDPPKAGALLAPGNVKVLPMPDSLDTRIVELFAGAKSTIDLSIYQLQERRVVKAITDAAGRGVKVRVMLEPKTVGSQNYTPMSNELQAAGVDVIVTPPDFDAHHNVDHAKFCILDGKELLFGTGNLVRSSIGGVTLGPYQLRDFWVEDTRPASVKTAQAIFEADHARKSTSSLDLGTIVLTPDNADDAIGSLVDGAKSRLYVYNQSLEDANLVDRFIAAKQRGVDVHVLLGYQPGFGGPPANDAAISKLSTAGIEAQYLKAHYLHGKAIVADGKTYLGSQNFTAGGLKNNRELGEIFDDTDVAGVVAGTFQADEKSPGL
jgi:hypothetical protein